MSGRPPRPQLVRDRERHRLLVMGDGATERPHDRIVQINLIGTDGLPIKAESQDRDLQVEQAHPHGAVVAKAPPRRPATKTTAKSQP